MEPWQMKYPVGSKWRTTNRGDVIIAAMNEFEMRGRPKDLVFKGVHPKGPGYITCFYRADGSPQYPDVPGYELVERVDTEGHVVPPPPGAAYPAFDPALHVVPPEARTDEYPDFDKDWRRRPQVFGAALRALYATSPFRSWMKKGIRNRLYRDPDVIALRATPTAAVALAYAKASNLVAPNLTDIEESIKAKMNPPKKLKRRA